MTAIASQSAPLIEMRIKPWIDYIHLESLRMIFSGLLAKEYLFIVYYSIVFMKNRNNDQLTEKASEQPLGQAYCILLEPNGNRKPVGGRGGRNESQHFQHTQAQNITLGGVLVLKHCQKHHFQHPQAQNIAYSDVLSQAAIPPAGRPFLFENTAKIIRANLHKRRTSQIAAFCRNPPPPRRRTRGDSSL